jgi:hypothetical protein
MLQQFNDTLPEGRKAKALQALKKKAATESAALDREEDDRRSAFDAEREAQLEASLTRVVNP